MKFAVFFNTVHGGDMAYINTILENLKKNNPAQPEFIQAAQEVLGTLRPVLESKPIYAKNKVLERLVEPERQFMFRVAWLDDNGEPHVNTGYRVQYNSANGPYKGGLRFHPSVNLGILKFLGFEQIFKNSLTGLAIGGAKGGSNFDPKGKSEAEIMRFCQAFMTSLYHFIGPTIDVPAGDIGVGGREIGYMYGQYKRLTSSHDGVLTGKGVNYGGSYARTEATGYGVVYFAENMLAAMGNALEGKTCTVSGSGNVAIYTIEKLHQRGAKAVTVSDSRGMIYHKAGINLEVLKQVKEGERASLTRYKEFCPDAEYTPVSAYPTGRNAVWSIPCQAAFPSATQNEINEADAKELLKNGCICVAEGANMPSNLEAIHQFLAAKIGFGPAKAANAGGVATSQLEMAQNASMQQWPFAQVDARLQEIMKGIFTSAHETAIEFKTPGNLLAGANIAGFRKVADNIIAQGVY